MFSKFILCIFLVRNVQAGLNAGEIAEYYTQQITTDEMKTCDQDNLLTTVYSNSDSTRNRRLPVSSVYKNYIGDVYANNKPVPGMRFGCKLEASYFQCDSLSVCQGKDQQSICTCDPSPSRQQSSCSCRGKCRVNTEGNKRYWNWQAPFELDMLEWNVCDCNDGWFGERCQFKKSDVSMAHLHRDPAWVEHFPFLPWYESDYIANYFMDEAREFNARDDRALELNRFSAIRSKVAYEGHRARTIWGYDDLSHSCPHGMTMYGIGTANVPYLLEDIGESNKPSRRFLFCGCIPGTNSVVDAGCSGHGKCELVIDTTWHPKWTSTDQLATQESPPIPTFGFPGMKVRQGFRGFETVQTLLPSKWSRCKCQKDYQGLYCERDVAPVERCGNGETSYGERPNGADGIEGCTCNLGKTPRGIPGVQNDRRTGRECTASGLCDVQQRSFKNRCLLDKDKSECGLNNEGIYNDYHSQFGLQISDRLEVTQKLSELYVCECRNLNVEDKVSKWPVDAEQAANTILQFIGKGCKESCREKRCHNHGSCRFIRRNTPQNILIGTSNYSFIVPFFNFNAANQNPGNSDWVYDSTGCNCDVGYGGAFCASSSVGGNECQGFFSSSQPEKPCADRCVWPDGGKDLTGWNRTVVYNLEEEICEARCPRWLKCDFTDMGCVPTKQECGGYGRGVCGGVDTSNYQRKCQCFDGYSGYDCGKVHCPRIAGVLVCGGSSRGWCDETKNTCVCKPVMYGDMCQFNLPTEGNQCAQSAQSVYNGPFLF